MFMFMYKAGMNALNALNGRWKRRECLCSVPERVEHTEHGGTKIGQIPNDRPSTTKGNLNSPQLFGIAEQFKLKEHIQLPENLNITSLEALMRQDGPGKADAPYSYINGQTTIP